jgi:hypothetical protein
VKVLAASAVFHINICHTLVLLTEDLSFTRGEKISDSLLTAHNDTMTPTTLLEDNKGIQKNLQTFKPIGCGITKTLSLTSLLNIKVLQLLAM